MGIIFGIASALGFFFVGVMVGAWAVLAKMNLDAKCRSEIAQCSDCGEWVHEKVMEHGCSRKNLIQAT